MTLEIPRHIDALNLHGAKISFKCNNNAITQVFYAAETRSTPLGTQVLAIYKRTMRSRLAYAAATAEWILWRLDGAVDVTPLRQFIESMWAAVIDYRYARPAWVPAGEEAGHIPPRPHVAGRDSHDPKQIESVLYCTWQKANATLLKCRDGSRNYNAFVGLSALARYVLPKQHQASFLTTWVTPIFKRMKLWEIAEGENNPKTLHGPPVPREAFDPSRKFSNKDSATLCNQFVAGLDYRTNPYLSTPAELKKLGFKGTPYSGVTSA